MSSTFEKYGGFEKVSEIAAAFYDKVLDSPLLAPYFMGTDMRRLIVHQSKFLAQIMGGPVSISNHELQFIHAGLRITDDVFDEMLTLLRKTFQDFELGEQDTNLLCGEIVARRSYIVAGR